MNAAYRGRSAVRFSTSICFPIGIAACGAFSPSSKSNFENVARQRFGIVFQDPSLDAELTAYENMDLHGVLYHMPRKTRAERTESLLKLFELWERRGELVKRFSGGMKRRLEIARGLLHTPK